jgi:hypothetical protein
MPHKTAYSDLEFLEIRFKVFLKNSEFFLEKWQKFVYVRVCISWSADILHELHLLIQIKNCTPKFEHFRISLKNFLKKSEIFLKKCRKFV